MGHGNGRRGRGKRDEARPETPTAPRFQVFLNTTSRERLTREFRIHAAIADAIIAHRLYESEADLLERGIIPERAYDRLRRDFLSYLERG